MEPEIKHLTKDMLSQHLMSFVTIAKNNIEDEYWSNENFLADLNRKWELSFFSTNVAGDVIGFLIASEKMDSTHIHKFVVDAGAQSQGLGTSMLNELKKLSNKPITLKLNSNNNRALLFYQRHGFVVSERNEHQIKMVYNLS